MEAAAATVKVAGKETIGAAEATTTVTQGGMEAVALTIRITTVVAAAVATTITIMEATAAAEEITVNITATAVINIRIETIINKDDDIDWDGLHVTFKIVYSSCS